MDNMFPHAVDCYRLVARDNLPPHPENEPIAIAVVNSIEEVEEVKKDFQERYPGCWIMERPLDTR